MLHWLKKFVRKAELNNRLNEICKLFGAVAEPSQKKFRRITNLDLSNIDELDELNSPFARIEDIDAIAIHIPKDKLKFFMEAFNDQIMREMELRATVPAIEKAYKHYKMMIQMCGGDYDARY